jgi:thiamine-phosphate diphosphorylase
MILHAAQGGVTMVQLREEDLETNQADAIKRLLQPYGVALIRNNDVAMVQKYPLLFEGVHLGQNDMDYVEARRRLGFEKIIGVSVGNRAELERIHTLPAGTVDYVTASAVYPSKVTKPDAPAMGLIGLEALLDYYSSSPLLLSAIGGVTTKTIEQFMSCTGPKTGNRIVGVALAGALLDAPDPYEVAKTLRKTIGKYTCK